MSERRFLQETNFDDENHAILNDVDKARLLAKQMRLKNYKQWEEEESEYLNESK